MKKLLLTFAGVLTLTLPGLAVDSPIYTAVKGHLVASAGKRTSHFDDTPLAPVKYYALYYSASWCGPCKAFTPKLVEWYQKTKPENPHFELIFVSQDNSEPDMAKYMADDHMPWPALDFKKKAQDKALTKYAGSGIPDLVLIDSDGKVLSDSFVDGKYAGPQKVLADIDKTLADNKPSPEAVAAAAKKPAGGSFDDFFKKK